MVKTVSNESLLICLGYCTVLSARAEGGACQHHPDEREIQDGHEEGAQEAAKAERLLQVEHWQPSRRRTPWQAGRREETY